MCLLSGRLHEAFSVMSDFNRVRLKAHPRLAFFKPNVFSVLLASRSPFCLPWMSCLPQSGSVDVCCTWAILKVNSFFSYCFSVQCCLLLVNPPSVATAPLQKPRSPAVGSGSFAAFPLLERSRGVLPRESLQSN